jgi:hypothetical protein
MATPENILRVAKDNKAKKADKAKTETEKAKDEKAEKTPESKPEKKVKLEKTVFPAEGKINKYGFIYLSGEVLAAFGLSKGAEHKLSINLEGDVLAIRKV